MLLLQAWSLYRPPNTYMQSFMMQDEPKMHFSKLIISSTFFFLGSNSYRPYAPPNIYFFYPLWQTVWPNRPLFNKHITLMML